jgi:hypothetical protein
VRIGTHTGERQLSSRLAQHFFNENKNRSIFRKNIGRCLLVQEKSDYLPIWELDTTSRKNKERYQFLVDKEYESAIEKKITQYVQENLTVSLLNVPQKDDRLLYESRLIGTVSLCESCTSSEHWLGRSSPVTKIRDSGLWQVMQLYSQPLSDSELSFIEQVLIR